MSLKESFQKEYKKSLFARQDDNGSIFYFQAKDFEGLNAKGVTIKSSKGHNLKGYFYYYDNFKENTLILFEHGMGAGHKQYTKEIEMLARHRYLVFSYDKTGCVESEGEGMGGFSQALCDSKDVMTYLKSLKELKDYKFYVVGHSMGGYATLNVVNYHKDIVKLVAISPMISVKHMHNQLFAGWKSFLKKYAHEVEKESNEDVMNVDVIDTLKNYKGQVLVMHSKDDKLALYKYHFKQLLKHFAETFNIHLVEYNHKNHNPNYTYDALKYKDDFFDKYKKALKENKLNTTEEKEAFKASFDWNKMTKQDEKVWEVIFDFLDN